MQYIVESKQFKDYLQETDIIDFSHPAIQKIMDSVEEEGVNEIEKVKVIYEFVRDQISHSWDIQSNIITLKASEVAELKTGICYAKSNLLAALLRKSGIPCGFCYQRLMLFDTPDKGYCLHAFNGVYIQSLKKWIVLDARGNKPGVEAEFSLTIEKLAFSVKEEMGEKTYPYIFVAPNKQTIDILKKSTDAIDMYKYHLPTSLFFVNRQ